MKKEYKKFGGLLYCYDPSTDFTVRVFKDGSDITTYYFKLSDWDDMGVYEECTKKEFKTALNTAIKKIREVTKMTTHNNEIENSRTGEGANVMKKEYKRYGRLIYCYYPESNFTVRVDSKTNEIITYHFKLSDWDDMGVYEECTKKEFKMAMYAAIKLLTK